MNLNPARSIRACLVVACFGIAALPACGDLDAPAPPPEGESVGSPITEGPSHQYLDRCGEDDGPPLLVARYPMDARFYQPGSHFGRFFYADGNHLGEDMALVPGTPIHPIGPGRIVHYGPQKDGRGYGRLYVGIEHDLGEARSFPAGAGGVTAPISTRWLLSVAGHLRPSKDPDGPDLPWKVGDRVTATDVIGYVEDSSCPDGLADDPNGDGLTHLHEGIRLACEDAAIAADLRAPLRGYDATSGTSFLLDFAAASRVVWQLGLNRLPVGSLVKLADDGNPATAEDAKVWLVSSDGVLEWLATEDDLKSRRLYLDSKDPFGRVLIADDLACFAKGSAQDWPLTMRVTRCSKERFGSGSATYLAVNDRGDKRRWLVPWESSQRAYHALLKSWGFRHDETVDDHEGCSWTDAGLLTMRDGVLIKEQSAADYAIVTDGGLARRLGAEFARQMGYDLGDGPSADAILIPDGATPALTRGFGPDWTADDVHRCGDGASKAPTSQNNAACGGLIHDPSGGGGDEPDAGTDAGTVCVPSEEKCNGKDDDCDGVVDQPFNLQWDVGNCGACGVSCIRPHAYTACLSGVCVPQSCDEGWTDADQDWSDGCEAPVVADAGTFPPPADAASDAATTQDAAPDSGPLTPDASAPETGSPCGHAVRFRFSGFGGAWSFYGDAVPMTPVSGALDTTVACVAPGWHTANGMFPGPQWLCEEWPLGTFLLPHGPLTVEVDGAPVAVATWHDPNIPGGVGCNLRFCVGGGCL